MHIYGRQWEDGVLAELSGPEREDAEYDADGEGSDATGSCAADAGTGSGTDAGAGIQPRTEFSVSGGHASGGAGGVGLGEWADAGADGEFFGAGGLAVSFPGRGFIAGEDEWGGGEFFEQQQWADAGCGELGEQLEQFKRR